MTENILSPIRRRVSLFAPLEDSENVTATFDDDETEAEPNKEEMSDDDES